MPGHRIHSIPLLVTLTITSCLMIGCGSSGAETAPVSGTVTVQGKPQANLVVSFLPQSDSSQAKGKASMAVTDAAGKFTLKTIDADPRDGALIGKHKVVIRLRAEERAEDDPVAAPKAKTQLPEKAIDGSLEFEVPAAGTTSADFQL